MRHRARVAPEPAESDISSTAAIDTSSDSGINPPDSTTPAASSKLCERIRSFKPSCSVWDMRFLSPKSGTVQERIEYFGVVFYMMATGSWFAEHVDINLTDADEVYHRMLDEWTAMGIISSLMLTLAFAGLSINLTNVSTTPVYVPIALIAVMAALGISVCASVLLCMSLMTLPKACAHSFCQQFKLLLAIPEVTLVLGVGLAVLIIVVMGWLAWGHTFLVITISIIAAATCFVGLLYVSLVNVLDRVGGLWELADVEDKKKEKREKKKHKKMSQGSRSSAAEAQQHSNLIFVQPTAHNNATLHYTPHHENFTD